MGCLLLAFLYAVSYLATVGLVYLITLCFGWTFSWIIATGIWFVLILLKGLFK